MVTIYFWWQNIKGIPESSDKALKIMQITTTMVMVLIAWCIYTVMVRNPSSARCRGFPTCIIRMTRSGWLRQTNCNHRFHGIFIGFGHSVLAMSGEETWRRCTAKSSIPSCRI